MTYRTIDDVLRWTKESTGGCLEWCRLVNKHGYGKARQGDHMVAAHRLSYELARGPIPSGMSILHSCDNRKCVNPDHLRAGTNQDNLDDRVMRNRSACGERHGRRRHPEKFVNNIKQGERNHFSFLTEEDIHKIRMSSGSGKAIAIKFGISKSHVNGIRSRRAWKHV